MDKWIGVLFPQQMTTQGFLQKHDWSTVARVQFPFELHQSKKCFRLQPVAQDDKKTHLHLKHNSLIKRFDSWAKDSTNKYSESNVSFHGKHPVPHHRIKPYEKSSKSDMQIGKTSISGSEPSFPVEPQLSIDSRAKSILLQVILNVKK